ncbi:MAG: hypothetical protein ACLFM7_09165, partial [Bacteroidales bacterium]
KTQASLPGNKINISSKRKLNHLFLNLYNPKPNRILSRNLMGFRFGLSKLAKKICNTAICPLYLYQQTNKALL